jgi:hypothetical protein
LFSNNCLALGNGEKCRDSHSKTKISKEIYTGIKANPEGIKANPEGIKANPEGD